MSNTGAQVQVPREDPNDSDSEEDHPARTRNFIFKRVLLVAQPEATPVINVLSKVLFTVPSLSPGRAVRATGSSASSPPRGPPSKFNLKLQVAPSRASHLVQYCEFRTWANRFNLKLNPLFSFRCPFKFKFRIYQSRSGLGPQ